MTAVEATQLGGSIVAVIVAVVMPIYLIRRSERHGAQERAEAARLLKESGQEVSWIAINKALVKERDKLQAELEEVAVQCARKHDELRDRLEAEAALLKRRYDEEQATLRLRIKHLKDEVDELNQRLWTGKGPSRPEPGDG